MADVALGGGIEFYRHATEKDHAMACLEAVRRAEDGFRIMNLDPFERKQVRGRILVTAKAPANASGAWKWSSVRIQQTTTTETKEGQNETCDEFDPEPT